MAHTRTSTSAAPKSSSVIAAEERQFQRTLDAGIDPLRGGAHSRSRRPNGWSGGAAEDLPRRRAGAARRCRLPTARHIWLPDRPDRSSWPPNTACASTVPVSKRHWPSSAQRSRGGRKAELTRHAEMQALLRPGRGAGRGDQVPGLRDDVFDRAGARPSCATAIEYERVEAVAEAELRVPAGAEAEIVLDQTPVLRGGRRAGRRPGCIATPPTAASRSRSRTRSDPCPG